MLTVKFDINDNEFIHLEIINIGKMSSGEYAYDYKLSFIATETTKFRGTVQHDREEGAFMLTMVCLGDWRRNKQSLRETVRQEKIIENETKYPADEETGATKCKATT